MTRVLDPRECEFRDHVLIDAFDVRHSRTIKSERRPSPRVPLTRVSVAEKRLYLELRGWTLGAGTFYLLEPKRANCCRLAEAFQYQIQQDMMITLRRFGVTPLTPHWYSLFRKIPPLYRQFFRLLFEGKLAEQSYLELQAVHLPERGKMLSIWCHYCVRFHNHGEGNGHRVAHCDVSDYGMNDKGYDLLDPRDTPQTLLDVYRPYRDEIRDLRVHALEGSRLGTGKAQGVLGANTPAQ